MSSWFGSKKETDTFDRHIQTYYQQQEQKVEGYRQLNRLTEECWDKCIRNPSSANGELSIKERKCLSSCASRWVDSMKLVEQQQRAFNNLVNTHQP